MKVDVYNQKGEKTAKMELNPAIFGVTKYDHLINQAAIFQMANERRATAKTKTKGEVRGGGRKPWRQKGTGRARAGSSRSPIWKGGGVTFGPTGNENYKKKMPKKMRQFALFATLSNKVRANEVIVLDKIEFKNIKTKQVNEMLNLLPAKEGTFLYVYSIAKPKILLSMKNLPYLTALSVSALNIVDILKYKFLLIEKETIKKIEEIYQKKESKK